MLRGWPAAEAIRAAICYEHVDRALT